MRFRLLILVALLAGLASVGCTPGSMSERKFTQVYADSLRGAFPDADFKIIDNLEIEGTAGELTYQHFLDNAYNDYKRSPEEIIPIIQRYLASSLSLYRNNGAIVGLSVENIVPVIREKAFASDMPEVHVSMLAKAYNDELIIAYAQDSETSISYLSKDDLDSLGISMEELEQQAIENTKRILTQVEKHGENGLYMITAGGNYESSLILWEGLWHKDNIEVDGDFIIAVPNRDMLLVTGSNDKANIKKLRSIAAESFEEGNYAISKSLFRWNGTKFERFD